MRRTVLVGVAALVLALPASALAKPKPQLLLFHPGAFVIGSPSFEHNAADFARRQGFKVLNVHYPRADLSGQLHYTARVARRAAKHGPVYAYGDSAGATLAARLAQRGLVRRAVVYSPVVNLQDWAATTPGPLVQELNDVSTARELRRLDLSVHDSARPILVLGGRDDPLCPNSVARTWASSDSLVSLRAVPGGHLGAGPDSPEYLATMHAGIQALAQ